MALMKYSERMRIVREILIRVWTWAFGNLPTAQRTVGAGFVWLICSFAIFGMLLGEFHKIKGPALLSGFWRMYVHGGVALFGILSWSIWKKGVSRFWGGSTLLLGFSPLIFRLVMNNRCFLQDEWLLYGPGMIALISALILVENSEESLSDWGAGLGDWSWWLPRMALAIGIMIPVVYLIMSLVFLAQRK